MNHPGKPRNRLEAGEFTHLAHGLVAYYVAHPQNRPQVARVFNFVDIFGSELHTINDPENKLPIPKISQAISIGFSRMQVESVTPKRTDSSGPTVYDVRVRLVLEANDQLFIN